MFSSNDGKKMEKYRPSTIQKNVNAAPLKWYLLKKMARDFSFKLIDNVQQ